MPLQIIATEGVFSPDAAQRAFAALTDLLLELNGLSGNAFLTPNVVGEVTVLPKGRTFSGGAPADVVIFELKVPSIVLASREAQLAWIEGATAILHTAAAGKVGRDRIWGNVTHAVDGLWGIAGKAYTNAELVAALTGAEPSATAAHG